jgi:putative flippase GtrA
LNFCVVGAVLAVIYFILAYAISSFVSLRPPVASGLAYFTMIPIAYLLHRVFTFQSKGEHKSALPRFVATSVLGFALSVLIPYLAVRALDSPAWSAYLAVCVIVPAFNFASMRTWVFATSARDKTAPTD